MSSPYSGRVLACFTFGKWGDKYLAFEVDCWDSNESSPPNLAVWLKILSTRR